ncbi:UDP-glucosyltransferase 29-like [Salvia miltiorrhiza]|uniref:UDP-glucosyltransferase 29-like n=1 Tax=Salvia miltiorrhiza TaxID=226208 RepID=UPI0025ACC0E2|nr:UDP-glucosyltransferase 29-like [Salvia miltiorrhiza]
MDAKQSDLRVLMFPWLAHGHVFPFLELAKGLAKKHFHIYFCSTPINLDSIKNSINNNNNNNDDHVSIELVELHLPTLPELPPHYHTTKNIPPHLMPTLMKAFQASAPAFSAIIARLEPDLLIYDGFQPWAARAAAAQGIPPVLFATSGSTSLAFFHHHHTHKSWDTFPFEGIRLKEHEKRGMIAAGESIKVSNVDGDNHFAFGMFKLSCEIVLIKTYRGFESKYMDYLSKLCERKLIPTGPLISHGDDDQDDQDLEIMKWLNEREEGSTLYISFGSENYLTKEQTVELAKGLELSGVNFIWVARSPAGGGGGAAIRKGRGVVVPGWAPQAAILAHRSVGGFMTHCGWSSVSESMFFGVPVVAVPFKADQPVNARVAAEAGIGVEVARGGDGGFDGDGVARAIKEVFVEGREGFKRRVEELREKMKVEEEGAMDEVVEELSRVCMKKSAATWDG